jgi:hypothetical protein
VGVFLWQPKKDVFDMGVGIYSEHQLRKLKKPSDMDKLIVLAMDPGADDALTSTTTVKLGAAASSLFSSSLSSTAVDLDDPPDDNKQPPPPSTSRAKEHLQDHALASWSSARYKVPSV